MHTYPHTIENGEGQELTSFGVVRHREGDRMEAEFLAPPDVGTPMHLHHLQEEVMTVVAGTLGLQFAGEQPRYVGPQSYQRSTSGALYPASGVSSSSGRRDTSR